MPPKLKIRYGLRRKVNGKWETKCGILETHGVWGTDEGQKAIRKIIYQQNPGWSIEGYGLPEEEN